MIISQIIRILSLFTLAFFASFVSIPVWLRIVKEINLGKHIRKDGAPIYSALHEKKEGTPTGGGVIVWFPLLFLILLLYLLAKFFNGFFSYLNILNRAQTYLPLAAFFGAAFLGLIDDVLGSLKSKKKKGLSIRFKLLVYSFIAIIGGLWFYFKLNWDVIHIPLVGDWQIGWIYIFFFAFVLIASAFSANETDGLDGLLGGTMLIAFMVEGLIAFLIKKYDLAAFIGMLEGSLLAFLWDNIYPAKFFGGDTLSMSLGISLGVISVLTNTVFLLPLFALIPFVESLSVIIQVSSKKIRGKKIFISTPIHHHFEAKGWKEPTITMKFWLISWLGALIGLIIYLLDRFLSLF